MLTLILSVVTVSAVLVYWAYCRRVALLHQEKAADVIVSYMDNDNIPDVDKDIAYSLYFFARHWVFLPLTVLVSLPLIVALGLGKKTKTGNKTTQVYRNDVTDEVMKMYATKNPITTAACAIPVLLIMAVVVPFGLLFDRINSLPSASAVINSVSSTAVSLTHHRH